MALDSSNSQGTETVTPLDLDRLIHHGGDESCAPLLRAAGWTDAQIAAVEAHLETTYNNFDEYANTDNLRLARTNVEPEVRAYNAAKIAGCCGGYDETIEVDGVTIMIGFNFGH